MGGIWTRPCIIWNSRTSLQSVRRCSNVRHWRSSNIPLTLLVLWWRFSVHRAARRWTISSWWIGFTSWGDHTAEAYSTCGRTRLLYSFSLMRGDRTLMFLLMVDASLTVTFGIGDFRAVHPVPPPRLRRNVTQFLLSLTCRTLTVSPNVEPPHSQHTKQRHR